MTATKEADVSTPSAAHLRMLPRWILVDQLLGGTEALRAAGTTRLPQHEKESNANYANRLNRATLVNAFEDTLNTLTGKPFEDDIVLGEDVPPAIEEMLMDIDLQGTALQPFARNWFREGWAKGFSCVLVDHPVPTQPVGADGQPRVRTLADDRAEALHPYWVHICPENVIAAYDEVVDGRRRLTHFRFMETSVERRGFEEVTVERIKVLEPGVFQVWVYNAQAKKWVLEEEGQTGLQHIPLVVFYSAPMKGLLECKPPLTDLAHLNIAHWQSSADQRNILTVSRFPILAASGVEEDTEVKVGPNNFLSTSDPSGKWYYVEHTGAAIEAGRKDLEDLENRMASYGSEFLRKRSGTETATARAIDSAESTSYLGATVQAFQDCLEQALQYTADWMKLETGGTVEIKGITEELPEAAAPELQALKDARASRDISRTAYLSELKRRRVLAEGYDADADRELLDQETPAETTGMFGGNATPVVPVVEGGGE